MLVNSPRTIVEAFSTRGLAMLCSSPRTVLEAFPSVHGSSTTRGSSHHRRETDGGLSSRKPEGRYRRGRER